jgi:hypothetical protein
MKTFRIAGSLNMDMVVTVDRFPRPGETISAKVAQSFRLFVFLRVTANLRFDALRFFSSKYGDLSCFCG